jgi:hypothetical protein
MKTSILAICVTCAISTVPASARSHHGPAPFVTRYDGSWHLIFTTRAGECDSSYEFDVNISHGIITHPNLVRFRGVVEPSGVARASVVVQDKSASGSGRLSGTQGRGLWSGYSGEARCSGYWTAQKD